MAGLVGYASSDEEEDGEEVIQQKTVTQAPTAASAASASKAEADDQAATATIASAVSQDAQTAPAVSQEPVVIGPVLQSATPLGPSLPPLEDPLADEPDSTQAPASPYSASRAMLRDLTLPTVPNFDIPPSPPGSPQPGANKKFEQFLELKKKGVHFNAKLEQSSALKNPSLMDKLMDFVEIDVKTQYSTTLSTELWDPTSFPEWASREHLKRAHEKTAKEKEAEKSSGGRSIIDFVSSTTSSGSTTVSGGLNRGEKRKGGWK